MKKILYIAVLVVVVLAMVVPATVTCVRGGGGETVSETGTLTFVDLEGGFHGILGDDGKKYDPINLSQEFHQDGLRVRFEGRLRTDLVSTHQWGTLIQITMIEKIGTK
ncbi:MAG: hypothetical protein HYX83_01205 [Chloroflexi bacterium]|nr:hypothetical protein [Chloroflexota bacterium]